MDEHLTPGADCHVRLGADLISHTWDGVVLTVLRHGSARRRDLLQAIGGVSDKALHESLGRLRARGLVLRLSPGDGYGLTPVGKAFAEGPLLHLAQWAEQHRDALTGCDEPSPSSGAVDSGP